jgi:hypothetical protein
MPAMLSKPAVIAVLLGSMVVTGAFAQATSPEFGRASGGQIEAITKQPTKLSGSLGVSISESNGYQATLGGTILQDRLWFFASAQQQESLWSGSELRPMLEPSVTEASNAKLTAQFGNRHSLAASFSAGRETIAASPVTFGGPVPSSFLSLRYGVAVSSNLFFHASVSQRSNMRVETVFGALPE